MAILAYLMMAHETMAMTGRMKAIQGKETIAIITV